LSRAHARRGRLAFALAVAVLVLAPSAASAIEIPGQAGATTPVAAPEPVPGESSLDGGAAPPQRSSVALTALRLGSRGPQVRDLQRELRRRGAKLGVDGTYGSATRRAVVRLQRRMGLPATGVADARLLRRLGLQVSTTAGSGTRPAVVPLKTFPVLGRYEYIDSWGAPRSQGAHEGTDIMATRNTPLLAVADGTVSRMSRSESGLGGIRLWLTDAVGNAFYYAHMQFIAAGIEEGSTLRSGQILGGVGNSGDARGGPTHVHFEIHPRGGNAVNPFPALTAVDPLRN